MAIDLFPETDEELTFENAQNTWDNQMDNFSQKLQQRYANNRQHPPSWVKQQATKLTKKPVDLLDKINSYMKEFKGKVDWGTVGRNVGPLKHHYGDLIPITANKVRGLVGSLGSIDISYWDFQQLTKSADQPKRERRDKDGKLKTGLHGAFSQLKGNIPMKLLEPARKHYEHKEHGAVVDPNKPDYYLGADPSWEWTPEIWVPDLSDEFLTSYKSVPAFDVLAKQWMAVHKSVQYIDYSWQPYKDALDRANKRLAKIGRVEFFKPYSNVNINDMVTESYVRGLIETNPWLYLGEQTPMETRMNQLEGTELPTIFDPTTGGEMEFTLPTGSADELKAYQEDYMTKLKNYYLKEQGGSLMWEGLTESSNPFSGHVTMQPTSGIDIAPPDIEDVTYSVIADGQVQPPHPQWKMTPADKSANIEVVDAWNQELDHSKLADTADLYIGFQWAYPHAEGTPEEEFAVLTLAIADIKVTWPADKPEGNVNISFKEALKGDYWNSMILRSREWGGRKRAAGDPTDTIYSNDFIRIGHFFNPSDPSSYDGIGMFVDEFRREMLETRHDYIANLGDAINKSAVMLVNVPRDKEAMCCLFMSFLDAQPDLDPEDFNWDSLTVKDPDNPGQTVPVQELLDRKRKKLESYKLIVDILLEGFFRIKDLGGLALNILDIMVTAIHLVISAGLNEVANYLLNELRTKANEWKKRQSDAMIKASDSKSVRNAKLIWAALARCLPLEKILMMLIDALLGISGPGILSFIRDYSARIMAKFKKLAAESNQDSLERWESEWWGEEAMYNMLLFAREILVWLLSLNLHGMAICAGYADGQLYFGPKGDNFSSDSGSEGDDELGWCTTPSGSVVKVTSSDCDDQQGTWIDPNNPTDPDDYTNAILPDSCPNGVTCWNGQCVDSLDACPDQGTADYTGQDYVDDSGTYVDDSGTCFGGGICAGLSMDECKLMPASAGCSWTPGSATDTPITWGYESCESGSGNMCAELGDACVNGLDCAWPLECVNGICSEGTAPELSIVACTDELATNYNPYAVIDDGGCTYNTDPYTWEPLIPCTLPNGSTAMLTADACADAGGTEATPATQSGQGDDTWLTDDPSWDPTTPWDPPADGNEVDGQNWSNAPNDDSPYTGGVGSGSYSGQFDITDTEIDPLKLLILADRMEIAKFFRQYIGLSAAEAAQTASRAKKRQCLDSLPSETAEEVITVLKGLGIDA
tara:strand:- start:2864 stop:6493 length:3630 start_codon:yes stop_codon:yes gene_type:complete